MSINYNTLAVVGLRAAGLAVEIAAAGKKTSKVERAARTSQGLYTLANLIEAGSATDDHMTLVAEKLKNREITEEDWDDVFARIESDSARLQAS